MDDRRDRTADARASAPGHPDEPRDPVLVQDELPLDEPVPYRLTPLGRRAVAPDDLPVLRVVDGAVPDAGSGPGSGGHEDLDRVDGTLRARARALRRAGEHTLDIAEDLRVDPLHVEAWVADLPPQPTTRRRAPLRAVADGAAQDEPGAVTAAAAAWAAGRDAGVAEGRAALPAATADATGLALVAGVLEEDVHGLVLVGEQLPVLAAAWRWVDTTLADRPVGLGPPADAGAAPLRVLVRHDPAEPADRVAHEVAAAFGVEASAVTTTRDPARAGRGPAVRCRVSAPALAGRVAGWRDVLLDRVAGEATAAQ